MAYELQVCPDAASWNAFVRTSPQQNVFSTTPFLDALGPDYRLLWVTDAGRPLLGTIQLLDDAGQPLPAPYAFSLYQGLLFDASLGAHSVHRRVQEELQLCTFLVDALSARDRLISLCIHPDVMDMRPLSWFHYHEPQLGRFEIGIAYTGLIDLRAPADFDAYLASIRYARRRDFRKAPEAGFTVSAERDVDAMATLYALTFARQGITIDPATSSLMRSICEAAISGEFGELLVCRDAASRPVAAALFVRDGRRGYYLIGANHPDFRNTPGGAFVVLEGIRRCRDLGLESVDVCGINSPGRGDFKVGLNAVPRAYHVATWRRPAHADGGSAVEGRSS